MVSGVDGARMARGRTKEGPVIDFPKDSQWFNTAPLSFHKELRGKIVVLDFWTYCCINCMHVLPELAALERKYADAPVVFVGVHSAKFTNEKSSENIRQAVLRYEIVHPVINDTDMAMWRQLGVHSWPTIVVVGPEGNLLLAASGEGQGSAIDKCIQDALRKYKGSLVEAPLPLQLEREKENGTSPLKFPAKMATDPAGKHLYISDSNNNRILICSLEGDILDIIGNGYAGLQDGIFRDAEFNRPQGICYHDNKLYVADTENHALRVIDLHTHMVETIAGCGVQGRDYRGGYTGKRQLLSSPWDVCVDASSGRLFIAMAGTHQIWVCYLKSGVCEAFSGSGAEMNYNSDDPFEAAWAQPSGLSLEGKELYVADSESSTVRSIDISTGRTRTLVGGDDEEPRNLFSYGDQDGVGDNAKLQHPLGVIWLPIEGVLAVADTYNHRIKKVDPQRGSITSWVGTGKPGYRDGDKDVSEFYEPSGFALSHDKKTLFVADTNNHVIRKIDISTGRVTTL